LICWRSCVTSARRSPPANETAFLLETLTAGYRVTSLAIPTVYNGQPSHFRRIADTWRLARVFSRHGRRILLGDGGGQGA